MCPWNRLPQPRELPKAARLGLGLISDVTDITVEGNDVIFTRPIYAGKAFQKKKFAGNKIFATIRPNNMAMEEADAARGTEQVELTVPIKDLRTIVKEV